MPIVITLSAITLSAGTLCVFMTLSAGTLCVFMTISAGKLCVFMTLSAGTLGVFMMNVVIQSAVILSVVAPIDSAAKQTKLAKKRERRKKKINFIPKISTSPTETFLMEMSSNSK
jgi:hypothetical protein